MKSLQHVLGMSAILAISTAAHSAMAANESAPWGIIQGNNTIEVVAYGLIEGHNYTISIWNDPFNGYKGEVVSGELKPVYNNYLGWGLDIKMQVDALCGDWYYHHGPVNLVDWGDDGGPTFGQIVYTSDGRSFIEWSTACNT